MMTHDGFFGAHLFGMVIMAVLIVVPFWRICSKAGYPGPLSLLMLLPIANLILLYFLAFARWPALEGRHRAD